MFVAGIVEGGIELASLDELARGCDARAVSARLVLTLSDRFEFESLSAVAKYIRAKSTKTPNKMTGAITHGGIESVFGSRSTTTRGTVAVGALSGLPQLGHATAAVEISCPHSGQYMSDMIAIFSFS